MYRATGLQADAGGVAEIFLVELADYIPAKKMLMPLLDVNLMSSSIGRMSEFRALVPESKAGPFPVLYLLHGLSHDHTAWTRYTNLERLRNCYPS